MPGNDFLQEEQYLPQTAVEQPQAMNPTGAGYGELNPLEPTSQAQGVVVQNPEETKQTMNEYAISDEKLEEIRQNVMREIERADNYYEEEIEPNVIKRHKVYESDAQYYKRKFPNLTNISDVTAKILDS